MPTDQKTSIANFSSIDGNVSSVFGYVLGQGEKAVYIQGGMHGGEITYWIFKRLFAKLKSKKLNKQIILVPMVNPFSWQQRSYFYTAGKFSFINGKDWLWSFPGSDTGTPMQRLAKQIYDVASTYEVSIDLHTSRKSVPFGIFTSEKYSSEISALGIPYNFISTYGDSPDQLSNGVASLSYSMTMNGKRGFTLECGSHDDYNEKHVELICNSLLNFLRAEKVIDEVPVRTTLATRQIIFRDEDFRTYKAPVTGFIRYLKLPGEAYLKGDALFIVIDSANLDTEIHMNAQENGVVLKISPTHIFQAGDIAIEVIKTHGK